MTFSLVAIRHAQTQWNIDKKLQGQRDIAVCKQGFESLQLRTVPARFRSIDWYCSPLTRTRETADALGLRYQIEPKLVEMHWGDWEGQRITELRAKLGNSMHEEEKRGLDMRPTNGESPREVQQRVLGWINSRPNVDKTTGIITHKGVIRSLVSAALDWDMTGPCPVKIDWNKAIVFEWDKQNGFSNNVVNLDW